MTPLSKAVRVARFEKRVTLRDVEASTGISNAHILQIESGKSDPGFEIAAKLSLALGFSLDEIAKFFKINPLKSSKMEKYLKREQAFKAGAQK
jgi:transcriptional regulator with XRE-family HTH domain